MRRPNFDLHASRRRSVWILRQWWPAIIVLATLVLILTTPVLKISSVNCWTTAGDCGLRHWEILRSKMSKLVFLIKPREIESQLLQDPSIKVAKVDIQFPNRLNARLEMETQLMPIGFINVNLADLDQPPQSTTSARLWQKEIMISDQPINNFYQINVNGELLPSQETKIEAFIIGDHQPDIEMLKSLHQLWRLINYDGFDIKKLWLTEDHFGLITNQNVIALLAFDQPGDKLLATLQQILSESTIDLANTVVDLRFKNPVIVKP